MNQRQRISLHDLTALRVDVNGERVRASLPRSRKQASSGKADTKGNSVLARPFIKLHKRRLDPDDEQKELPDDSKDNNEIEGYRAPKKRRRDHYIPDVLPFLHPPMDQPNEGDRHVENLPSSDLLKVVHHFASCFYDERGLLTAAARSARLARRFKEKENPESRGVISRREESPWEEVEDLQPEESGTRATAIIARTSSPSSTRPNNHTSTRSAAYPEGARIKDMYKALDGSALLLIGLLLQAHIESRINRPPPLPSEWEAHIRDEKQRIEKRSMRGRKQTRLSTSLEATGDLEEEVNSPEEGSQSDSEDRNS